ncbi:hypothetical protein ASF88_14590 [Leifsonia sp. Leaf336]|uniref:hypothetical protein n=1 Tax=Leifsonia sp. Leaf336 TaxID=1736341 RepID=UPI0006FADB05|nr:hypothetical protein [Leifsonia sp. Leaf336]KQR52716.1 hypothetical protein ASF88_14590 [Leifsonia sp. Leaf336]
MRSRSLVPVALVVALAALAMPAVLASPASAATTGLWAGWATTGTNAFSVQVANLPAMTATVRTDSRQGQIGVISGASTWLAAGTPVGAKYGSSQGRPYLNLRPKADSPTAPSTTTYSFAAPTPTSGWTFVLGDIDADKVQVRASAPTAPFCRRLSSAIAAASTTARRASPASRRAQAPRRMCRRGTRPPSR